MFQITFLPILFRGPRHLLFDLPSLLERFVRTNDQCLVTQPITTQNASVNFNAEIPSNLASVNISSDMLPPGGQNEPSAFRRNQTR